MSAADVIVKPTDKNTYFSGREDLVLVRTAVIKQYDAHGRERGETPPDRIVFRGNRYETSKPDEIEFLDNHRCFGDPFEGFVKQQMPAPAPSQEEIKAIIAASQDRVELLEILKAENSGFQRPALLELVADAIERLDAAEKPAEAPQKADAKAAGAKA